MLVALGIILAVFVAFLPFLLGLGLGLAHERQRVVHRARRRRSYEVH